MYLMEWSAGASGGTQRERRQYHNGGYFDNRILKGPWRSKMGVKKTREKVVAVVRIGDDKGLDKWS